MYAALLPYLFSTEVFDNNKDIKEFIDKLKLSRPVKDYLYAARPQIVARIAKEIYIADKETLVANMNILKADTERLIQESRNSNLGETPKKKDFSEIINKYSRNKDKENDWITRH